jgi:hypothetical protein
LPILLKLPKNAPLNGTREAHVKTLFWQARPLSYRIFQVGLHRIIVLNKKMDLGIINAHVMLCF